MDLIHVTEHLWDAAWCLFPKASPDAGGWVRARTAQILDGGPAGAAAVAAALRRAAARLGRTRRATAEKTAGYLEAKAPYLDYPAALAAGWPIATGVIEGACRHLVKDRMDITGARWGVQTAEAILKLRALHANGDFDAYWQYHLQCEHERNHPASYALAGCRPARGGGRLGRRGMISGRRLSGRAGDAGTTGGRGWPTRPPGASGRRSPGGRPRPPR